MPLTPDRSALARMKLFAGLDAEAVDDVLRRAATRLLAKGTRVFAQGDPARTCHALIDGRVKIVQANAEGQQVVVRFIGPGEMFGTVAVLMERPYPADAVAVADSVEVNWTADAMRELMTRHPQIAINASRVSGERLMELQQRVRELSTERVEQRIARTLLRLMHQAGRPLDTGVEIDFPISRQDLAEMTGATLHTVSRTLAAWEGEGVVASGRRHIVIRDADALAAIAENRRT